LGTASAKRLLRRQDTIAYVEAVEKAVSDPAVLARGNLLSQARVVPHSAISFMTFDVYERLLCTHVFQRDADVTSRFLAGAAAGTTATVATYPMDLIRARTTAHWGVEPKYSGFSAALRHILQAEGPRALVSGLGPTVVGIIPYAGLSFATFGTLKSLFAAFAPPDKPLPTPHTLLAGALAGLVAQTATYPLHVVRRRMQVWALFLVVFGCVFIYLYFVCVCIGLARPPNHSLHESRLDNRCIRM
jgi:hypothetical protein